jgi:hydrogenase nickel incorporation protein HypA/HybF
MHEASLVQGIISAAVAAMEHHNAEKPQNRALRIQEIECEIGLISCVEPQTLTGCFELLAEGTPAEGAALTLRTAPLDCNCTVCGHAFQLTQRHFACPGCGSDEIHFNGGHGLTLTALHVETEE